MRHGLWNRSYIGHALCQSSVMQGFFADTAAPDYQNRIDGAVRSIGYGRIIDCTIVFFDERSVGQLIYLILITAFAYPRFQRYRAS